MQIGVLTHNYPRYGGDFSGVFVEALCKEFCRQGEAVTVWAPHDEAWVGAAHNTLLRDGVEIRLYRYGWPDNVERLGYMRSMQSDLALRLENYALSPLLFASGAATLLRDVAHNRPDVLHAHWLLPNGYLAALASRRHGIPLVVSVPGSDAQVAGANPLFRAMARFVFRQASLLTANSEELRDAVIDLGADPARFKMIIYGTDPERMRPDSTHTLRLRRQWANSLGIDADQTIFVLGVGRMAPKKGFDVLIRALTEPALRDRPVAAVLVGNGDEKTGWQALAQELGVANRLLWPGNVPVTEITDWYNAADLLAMPSVSRPADGLNVCVVDAMSCGRPVVASTVAGNPLAVVHGATGFLVPEQEPAALAQSIAVLAEQPSLRAAMGEAGRRRVVDALGWPALARRYREEFSRLAPQSGRA